MTMKSVAGKQRNEVGQLSDDAGYVMAAEKLGELHGRVAELERTREALSVNLHQSLAATDEWARRLLADGLVPRIGEGGIRHELEAIVDELGVVRRAVELQTATVERERQRVSQAVCEQLMPAYRKIIAAMAEGLKAYDRAAEEERQLREAIVDAGFMFFLRPANLGRLGLLTDPDSAIASWFRDVAEFGLLE